MMNKNEVKKALNALHAEYLKKEEALLDNLTKAERMELGHPIKSVKTLDSFNANKKRYIIRTSLPISRFEEFEKLEVEVGYGMGFEKIFGNIRKAFDYLNESEPANASVILFNIMNGIKDKLDERENPVLLLCALFICEPNEDVSKFDLELNKRKIDDWRKEGISMESFFGLAFNLVNGFIPLSEQVSKSISTRRSNEKTRGQKRKN